MSLSNLRRSIISIKSLSRAVSAMRILSMSSHTLIKKEIEHLNKSLSFLVELEKEINIYPLLKNNFCIYIFIGSSKGLCGNYNHEVKKKFIEKINDYKKSKNKIIIIGKKLISSLKSEILSNCILIEKFGQKEISKIIEIILNESENFDLIKFHYINSKTLFERNFLIENLNCNFNLILDLKNISTGHFSNESILNSYKKIYKYYYINLILNNALLSEQGSRFISMDAAYRNSKKIIHEKELFYNKKRQSIITNSSLELNSSFFL